MITIYCKIVIICLQMLYTNRGEITMSKTVKSGRDIPDAPYYVLANDSFFSNSPLFSGTNTVVLPCADYAEADYVEKRLRRDRDDLKRIRIVSNKPRIRQGVD